MKDITRLGSWYNMQDNVHNKMSETNLLFSTVKTLYDKNVELRSDRDSNALGKDKVQKIIPSSVLKIEYVKKLCPIVPKLTNNFTSDAIIEMFRQTNGSDFPSLINLNMLGEQPSAINSPPVDTWEARKDWFEYLLLEIDFEFFPFNAAPALQKKKQQPMSLKAAKSTFVFLIASMRPSNPPVSGTFKTILYNPTSWYPLWIVAKEVKDTHSWFYRAVTWGSDLLSGSTFELLKSTYLSVDKLRTLVKKHQKPESFVRAFRQALNDDGTSTSSQDQTTGKSFSHHIILIYLYSPFLQTALNLPRNSLPGTSQ